VNLKIFKTTLFLYFCSLYYLLQGMKVLIASDHAGFELKEKIKKQFGNEFDFVDYGTHSTDSVDYPSFAHPLSDNVASTENQFGVLICGTGNGMQMCANKHADVRAALCWNPEIAALARQHNNANILVMPARFIDEQVAFETFTRFFETAFEGGRHERRVLRINLD